MSVEGPAQRGALHHRLQGTAIFRLLFFLLLVVAAAVFILFLIFPVATAFIGRLVGAVAVMRSAAALFRTAVLLFAVLLFLLVAAAAVAIGLLAAATIFGLGTALVVVGAFHGLGLARAFFRLRRLGLLGLRLFLGDDGAVFERDGVVRGQLGRVGQWGLLGPGRAAE